MGGCSSKYRTYLGDREKKPKRTTVEVRLGSEWDQRSFASDSKALNSDATKENDRQALGGFPAPGPLASLLLKGSRARSFAGLSSPGVIGV